MLLVFHVPASSQAFDSWLEELRSAPDTNARILARIESQGGTPLRSGDQVLFLAKANRNRAPQVVGDFNDNGYAESAFPANGKMERIAESDWFGLEATLPRSARLEYLLRWGDELRADPANPRRASTFGSERSVVAGPAVRSAPTVAGDVSLSRIDRFSVARDRDRSGHAVAVYVPSTLAPGGSLLPTLYVKDGRRFLDEVDLPSILDALIQNQRIRPAVVVFVDPRERAADYGTSASYRTWVVETLVPEIERRYATGGSPSRRGLLGASRGGLAVVDLARRHPEIFGFCAALSPSLSPLPIVAQVEAEERRLGQFLVLVSRYDNPTLLRDGRALAAALGPRSQSLVTREVPIDHSPLGWRAWADFVLLSWPVLAVD